MPQSEPFRRDRAPDRQDPERLGSVRDRLELIGLVLRELDFLRQRQELLVRTALQEEEVQEAQLDSEENILVLNRLRRRDAALITQLHQLDQQIQDLRLDPETSQDQLEPDSRPSSGFYELSDGTSASLSNSSHSVFSEGFCSAADSEGPLPLKEKPVGSLDWDVLVGGLCGDSSSSPHQSSLDPVPLLVPKEFQSKPFSGLWAQNVSETSRYPTPQHSVAVQDPGFPQTRDAVGTEPETSPPVPQNSFPQTHSNKHLDKYIYSLLQRRAQPIRTSRPRTSFSTDPSKNILRQTSVYGRQMSGPDSGLGTPKSSFHAGGTSAESGPVSSSQRQSEEQNVSPGDMIRTGLRVTSSDSSSSGGCHVQNGGSVSIWDNNTKRGKGPSTHSAAALLKDFRNQGSPSANSSHKKTRQPGCSTDQELDHKSSLVGDGLGSNWEDRPGRTQTSSSRNRSQLLQSGPAKNPEKTDPQISSLGGSSKNLTGGGRDGPGSDVGNSWYLTAKQQNLKDCSGSSKNIKTSKTALRTLLAPEANEMPLEKAGDKSGHKSRTILLLEDGGAAHIKTPHNGKALRKKNIPASVSERRVPDKYTKTNSLQSGGSKPHRHRIQRHYNHRRRASHQPKSKREDPRRLRVISEVPSGRGTKRVPQRHPHPPCGGQKSSPYSYVTGSDSEYSAECLSLFHSTIVDTSEDERSNYTTNCFGDRESSEEESVEEDLEESVGGGPVVRGRGARQPGPEQDFHQGHTKTLVKIKASHNLKKKILRSRSGSLKLMTTV